MPASLTNVASLVQSNDSKEWRIRAGDDLPKFLVANGPGRITSYNFKVLQESTWLDRAVRIGSGDKKDYSDMFQLTAAGRRSVGSLLAWRVELACTGASLYHKPPPNCRRVCCGGFGGCLLGCDDCGSFDGCSVRILITATLDDVKSGYVSVVLRGEHVPSGMQMIPPPADGLKPMPAALRGLRNECAKGELPTRVVNAAVAALGEGAERNTRLAPPARVLAGCKERDKRKARGGSMDDATRIDELVRRHLIHRGMVLLYKPGEQLVLATAWGLEQARSARMISIDAKCDTVTGIRSKWVSVRFKTARGLSAPGCVWITPEEPAETVTLGICALQCNMRCNVPSCPHTLIETHGGDGHYERRLSCQLWWLPPAVLDKHIPSFNGLRSAGLMRLFLCAWHGYNCFDSRLIEIGFTDKAADIANWGFRLLTRAATDEKSFDLRDALACMLVRHAAMPDRLWTLDQAEELIEYIDKCWMYPNMIRLSWIDAPRLELVKKQGKAGFLNATSINEGSHQKWDSIMMKSQQNRLISETIVKTLGITADGQLAVGGSFFQDAQTRWSDAEGQPLPESTDRKVTQLPSPSPNPEPKPNPGPDPCPYPYPDLNPNQGTARQGLPRLPQARPGLHLPAHT